MHTASSTSSWLDKSARASHHASEKLQDGRRLMVKVYLFLLCLFNYSQSVQSALTVMRTDSFDTVDSPSFCDSRRFDVLEGASGIVYSHQPYYPASIYRPGRDCFMTLKVPAGYRVELVVLEFQVDERYASSSRRCAGDSLHIFDQDKPDTLPKRTQSHQGKGQEEHSLSAILSGNSSVASPIKANLCGRIKNNTVIARSTMNIITLWWHSDPAAAAAPRTASNSDRISSPSIARRGFKLQWTAFRDSTAAACHEEDEFACDNGNMCIPVELACDNMAHCSDRSDLLPNRQRSAGCENVASEAGSSTARFTIGSLAGVCIGSILLLVLALVLLSVCRKRRRQAHRQHKYNQAPLASGQGGGCFPTGGTAVTSSTNKSSNSSNSDSSRCEPGKDMVNNQPIAMQHQLAPGFAPAKRVENGALVVAPNRTGTALYHTAENGVPYQTKLLYHNHHHYVPPIAPPPSMVGANPANSYQNNRHRQQFPQQRVN